MSVTSAVLWLEYISPAGKSITFGLNDPYLLVEVEGLSEDDRDAVTSQAPGQVGVTVLDIATQARVIPIMVEVLGDDWEQFWELRGELVNTLVMRPLRPGGTMELGVLRAHRMGHEPREIPAIPRRQPRITINTYDSRGIADIEFFCPGSDWRDLSDSNIQLMPGETGMTFPMTFPFSMAAGQAEADVVNAGDVPAPVLIRVWGEITTPRIINSTTGESIEVAGSIAEGEFLEIETAFGEKRVELVHNDGSRTNWMSHLNLDDSDFWHLTTGVNTVRLQADANVSGTAWVTWRNRYSGI